MYFSDSPRKLQKDLKLFPLYRGRRLAGDVVHHAVDAPHFVDDAVGHPRQQGAEASPTANHSTAFVPCRRLPAIHRQPIYTLLKSRTSPKC